LLQRVDKEIEAEILDDQTYFCSELIAACYKKIDILPSTISASQYLPSKKLSLLS